MEIRDEIEESVEALKRQRDELRVKLHLASMEVQAEWDALEEKWEELVAKSRQIKKELDPTLDDIHIAFKLLEEELKDGYKKLKGAL